MCRAKDYIENFIDSVEQSQKDYDEMKQDLDKVERQITDVEHFIENDNFNIIQGYYYSKALKKLRNKRRILKNELETLEILNNVFNKTINIDFYKKAQKDINGKEKLLQKLLREQTYNTRELHNIDKYNIKEYCNSI